MEAVGHPADADEPAADRPRRTPAGRLLGRLRPERKQILDYVIDNGVQNVVALTGDIHTFFAGTATTTGDEAPATAAPSPSSSAARPPRPASPRRPGSRRRCSRPSAIQPARLLRLRQERLRRRRGAAERPHLRVQVGRCQGAGRDRLDARQVPRPPGAARRNASPSAEPLRSPAVDFKLTDEQNDFVAAIRDFCRARGRHRREARGADRGLHSSTTTTALYKKMAELGWLGVTIPEEYGGSGGSYARRLPVHGGDLPRHGADRRLRHHPDRRRRHQALRHRRAEEEDPRRHLVRAPSRRSR